MHRIKNPREDKSAGAYCAVWDPVAYRYMKKDDLSSTIEQHQHPAKEPCGPLLVLHIEVKPRAGQHQEDKESDEHHCAGTKVRIARSKPRTDESHARQEADHLQVRLLELSSNTSSLVGGRQHRVDKRLHHACCVSD